MKTTTTERSLRKRFSRSTPSARKRSARYSVTLTRSCTRGSDSPGYARPSSSQFALLSSHKVRCA
ncbi:hypothetical protein N657DRAFT_243773, partial [Parathielavia appendiculata]